MTAKEYMEQASYLDMQINSKIEQIRNLNELATKATTVYSDMPHSPNRNTSRMEETVVKIIDLESEIGKDTARNTDSLTDRQLQSVVTTASGVGSVKLTSASTQCVYVVCSKDDTFQQRLSTTYNHTVTILF